MSFGWMIKADDSCHFPLHSTWQFQNFHCMRTSLEPAQPGCLPAPMNPGSCPFIASMAMPGFAVPSISGLKTQRSNETHGLPQSLPSQFQKLLPTTNQYLKENLSVFSHGLGVEAVPNATTQCQRRFIIFDQSGTDTRLIYSSLCPSAPKRTIAALEPIHDNYSPYGEHTATVGKVNLTKPKLLETLDEHQLSGEESEMHEDTEEINALLYSDDDDYYDADGDNDEVTSIGHSPILIKGSYWTQGQLEEIIEEVASSDGLNKRQRLLDGGYIKSSVVDTASSVKVEGSNRHDDGESSYAIGRNQEGKLVSILGNKQSRNDKIRATLKILQSIIPGAEFKDPFVVLDEAISYLKSLKLKAKTLGVNWH